MLANTARNVGTVTLGAGALAASGAAAYNYQQGGIVPVGQGAGYTVGAAALGYGAYKLRKGDAFDRLEHLRGVAADMGTSASRYRKYGGLGIGSLALGAGVYTKRQYDQGDYGAMVLGGASTLGLTMGSLGGFASASARQRVADSLGDAVEVAENLGKRVSKHMGRAGSFKRARNLGAAGVALGGAATIHGMIKNNDTEQGLGLAGVAGGGVALAIGSGGRKYQMGRVSKFKRLRNDVLDAGMSVAEAGPTSGIFTRTALDSTGRAVQRANKALRPNILSRSITALRGIF